MTSFPLVYHFTGATLPKWALTTLENAPERWLGSVVMLHDRDNVPRVSGVDFVDVRDWYDPEPFRVATKSLERPVDFRDGFWFHAIERFYMLAQWSEITGLSRFLHAELDVLLMMRSKFGAPSWPSAPGIWFPRSSQENAGANVLYVNGRGALNPLLTFFANNTGDVYEMGLLAQFLDESPSNAGALPSHLSLEPNLSAKPAINLTSLSEFGGVVDVHPMGTWIFGHDPRNVRSGPVYNHFYYSKIGSPFVERLRYSVKGRDGQLFVRNVDGSEWPVFALHVHSKLMRFAFNSVGLRFFVWLANLPWKSPIVLQHLDKGPRRFLRRLMDSAYKCARNSFRKFAYDVSASESPSGGKEPNV